MLCTNIVLNVKQKQKNNFCTQYVVNFSWNSMNNLLSFCGLTDARMRASEKDLPVQKEIEIGKSIYDLSGKFCKFR